MPTTLEKLACTVVHPDDCSRPRAVYYAHLERMDKLSFCGFTCNKTTSNFLDVLIDAMK